MSQAGKGDIIPINGPARFAFMLGELPEASLSDWPPEQVNPVVWDSGLTEINRHRDILRRKVIWSAYPILSFSVGDSHGPVPNSELSAREQIIKEVIDGKDGDKLNKVSIRFFLFPHANPTHQSQAVAQVCCDTCVGASLGDVRMWVDALREDELSADNLSDIRAALVRLNIQNIQELMSKYPDKLRVISQEEDVASVDMDKVMSSERRDFDTYAEDLTDYISHHLSGGEEIAILPAGKTTLLVLAANGLFKK